MASRRAVMILVGAALCLGLGVLLGFALDKGEPAAPSKTPTEPATESVGPSDEVDGVPVGYARTEGGAVSAATNFHLLSANDELFSRDELVGAMRILAAPKWKNEAVRQATAGYKYLVDTYGADADVATAAIRYDVTHFDPSRAIVRLWIVGAFAGQNRPGVEATWSVVTTELEWVEGDWRVSGTASSPGPAPMEIPLQQPQLNATEVMEDFDEYRGAPVP